jgi:hypothetical protein
VVRRITRLSRFAIVVLLACACSSGKGGGGGVPPRDAAAEASSEGDVGDPNAALCALYATVPAGAPTPFALVQKIFDDNCETCHTAGTVLDLTAGHAWPDLVNQPPVPDEACGGTLVVPGNVAASYLYQKLTVDNPCAGFRMPRTEFGPGALPACVTDHVAAWIAEGAPPPGAADGGVDAAGD